MTRLTHIFIGYQMRLNFYDLSITNIVRGDLQKNNTWLLISLKKMNYEKTQLPWDKLSPRQSCGSTRPPGTSSSRGGAPGQPQIVNPIITLVENEALTYFAVAQRGSVCLLVGMLTALEDGLSELDVHAVDAGVEIGGDLKVLLAK